MIKPLALNQLSTEHKSLVNAMLADLEGTPVDSSSTVLACQQFIAQGKIIFSTQFVARGKTPCLSRILIP